MKHLNTLKALNPLYTKIKTTLQLDTLNNINNNSTINSSELNNVIFIYKLF
jgi:hypothetical protein